MLTKQQKDPYIWDKTIKIRKKDGSYELEKETIDLLELYRNYLFSLEARKEFGDKYGDPEELIETYEKKLKVKKKVIKEK